MSTEPRATPATPASLNTLVKGVRRWGSGTALILGGCALLLAPFSGFSEYDLFLLNKAMAFALWAMGLDLLIGYTGLVSFGHAAWLGLGAYSAGYVAREQSSDILISLGACIVVVAVLAALLGAIATRVSGIAFAIVTLSIGAIVQIVIIRLPRDFAGGGTGLFGVPLPTIFGHTIEPGTELYLATTALLILVFVLLRFLVRTPFGHSLQAIRENETRARFIGINVTAHRWAAYILSAMVSALGGAMFVFLQGGMSTQEFHWTRSGDVLVMVIIGGMGTLYGSVLGALFFTFVFMKLIGQGDEGWQIYYGGIFLVAVMLFPRGFTGSLPYIYSFLNQLNWKKWKTFSRSIN